mmetsp:Transcript_40903/g.64444  ORF Transcript_40903/g.64444 Transcript_40903/m.64444 type:complete len:245 (+) Transcript_40903:207-941(+)
MSPSHLMGGHHDIGLGGIAPEDHPLHMTGFLRQLSHDEILPATVHREGHHGVPHGEPVGAAHQLIAVEVLPVHFLIDLAEDRYRLGPARPLHEHSRIELLNGTYHLTGHGMLWHRNHEFRLIHARHFSRVGIDPLIPSQRLPIGPHVLNTSPLNLLPIHDLRGLRHPRDGHLHPRGQHAAGHQRHLRRRRPHDLEARRRHLGDGDVAGVHQATLENGAEVFVEVLRTEPKKSILALLRKLLAVR